jgi:DNA-binding NarL/FixJ family response regulator
MEDKNVTEIRVLLVDDFLPLMSGIKSLLDDYEGIRVIGEVEDGETAVLHVLGKRPDVTLMDMSMPEMDGAEAACKILESWPEAKIIHLTSSPTVELVESLLAGAAGYMYKSCETEDLVTAIRSAHQGKRGITPERPGGGDERLPETSMSIRKARKRKEASLEVPEPLSKKEEVVVPVSVLRTVEVKPEPPVISPPPKSIFVRIWEAVRQWVR